MKGTEFLKAKLARGSQSFDIAYQVALTADGADWGGEFHAEDEIKPGEYELVAEDGRRGTINVIRVFPGDRTSLCDFQGIGSFD